MSRAVALAAALVVFAVLGATLVIALVAGGVGSRDVRLDGAAVSVEQVLSPRDPQFGDTVDAEVRLIVDTRRVDLSSVRVSTAFAPFRKRGQMRSVRRFGPAAIVDVAQRLYCLDAACVPRQAQQTVTFPPLIVKYRTGAEWKRLVSPWEPVRVHARVVPADVRAPSFRAGDLSSVALGYRVAPHLAGEAILVVASVLALVGAVALLHFAAPQLIRHSRPETRLQQVLREVAASSARGDESRRRRALDALARELVATDPALASESTVLAWAEPDPPKALVDDLAGRVAREVR